MDINNLPNVILDAISQHIPPEAAWIPTLMLAVTAFLGVMFMVKGARLAPALSAIVFALVGGVMGTFLPGLLGTPLWPTVFVSGAAGLVLGLLLFKVWLAVLVGVCLASAGLSVYSGRVLREPLSEYLAAGLDTQQQLVTLPAAVDGSVEAPSPGEELGRLWSYLAENVESFETSFFAIVISTGLAGLIFGLALPRAARSFVAATLGTGLLLLAAGAFTRTYWPAGVDLLNQWGLLTAGVLWCAALVYNIADQRPARPRKNGHCRRIGVARVIGGHLGNGELPQSMNVSHHTSMGAAAARPLGVVACRTISI